MEKEKKNSRMAILILGIISMANQKAMASINGSTVAPTVGTSRTGSAMEKAYGYQIT